MKRIFVYIVSIYFLLLFVNPAYAYLDPGSGSMVLQILLGVVAGVVVFFKFFWRRMLALFGYGRKEKDNPEQLDTKR